MDLWLEEWKNPLAVDVPVRDPAVFLQKITAPVGQADNNFYVDKLSTGFLVWAPSIKAYHLPPPEQSAQEWEGASQPALQAIREVFSADGYFSQIAQLFGQESNKEANRLTLRSENAIFIKSIGTSMKCMPEAVPNAYLQPRCISLISLVRSSLQSTRHLQRTIGSNSEQQQRYWLVC